MVQIIVSRGLQSLSYFVCSWGGLRLLSKLGAKPVPGRAVFLFRAFFPSWRFFDQLGDIPILEYRWANHSDHFGTWLRCIERSNLKAYSIAFNSIGNLEMAYQSLLQQFLSDLAELQEQLGPNQELSVADKLIRELTSYRLVQNWVRHRAVSEASRSEIRTEVIQYQFRLRTQFAGVDAHSFEDVLISGIEVATLSDSRGEKERSFDASSTH